MFGLAIAGRRVAWMINLGGNTEGDDYIYASSVVTPNERQVASDVRFGDNCPGRSEALCPGRWLGGLVGSGNLIALNRWTTDDNGSIKDGELDLLNGTRLKQIATSPDTVVAADADGGRMAVLRADGSVGLYSLAGDLLRTVGTASAKEVALSGPKLVAVTAAHTLELYNARTGWLVKTFDIRGTNAPVNLDVQGNIAIYTVGSALHAVNLSSGKNRVVAELRGGPILARIDSAGLVYAANRYGYRKGTRLAFVPYARVKAAVG